MVLAPRRVPGLATETTLSPTTQAEHQALQRIGHAHTLHLTHDHRTGERLTAEITSKAVVNPITHFSISWVGEGGLGVRRVRLEGVSGGELVRIMVSPIERGGETGLVLVLGSIYRADGIRILSKKKTVRDHGFCMSYPDWSLVFFYL